MKISLETTVGLSAGTLSKLGAAVEFTLTSGRQATPVKIWVGACRASFVSAGRFDDVVAGLLRAAITAHIYAINEHARAIGAGPELTGADVETLVAELLPRVGEQIAGMPKVVAEITAPDPAKTAAAE